MKLLLSGLAVSLGIFSSSVHAEVTVSIDGKDYTLTALMENCQTMKDNPAAQIACFNAVSALLDQQSAAPQPAVTASVPEAFEALRAAAQYDGNETGLIIQANGCNAHILYYANYFRVSRRNVSTIDLFSAQFDAASIDFDRTEAAGGNGLVSTGVMEPGAVAATVGGEAIGSAQYNFAPKSARMTVGDYAMDVANQLTASESSAFSFVLVHPERQQSRAAIWDAFKVYVEACKG